MNTTIASPLEKELSAFKDTWTAGANNDVVTKFENGIAALHQSGMAETALNLGDRISDFELVNAVGKKVKLSDVLQQGPVVLSWYRGGWCPYCNIELRSLQQHLPAFKALGASLLALSPELPDKSLDTKEKNNLAFEVLTDYNNNVARQFGIVFQLNEELIPVYNDFHKLEDYNGVDTNELPIPATFVIDTDFTVRYAFVDPDYRRRADPEEILSVLKTMYNVESKR